MNRTGGKPVAGSNVTVPAGWSLLLDESPPALGLLVVLGSLLFDPLQDITLTAAAVMVLAGGVLSAGSREAPHLTVARILLTGQPSDQGFTLPQLEAAETGPGYLAGDNIGSKVLVVAAGGRLSLHGRPVTARWTRLGRAVVPGDSTVRIPGSRSNASQQGIQVGDRLMIASTSYNQYQSEVRQITALAPQHSENLTVVVLDAPLLHPHAARGRSYPVSSTTTNSTLSVDLRAEVALLSSNVGIAAAEAYTLSMNASQQPPMDLNRLYGTPGGDTPATAAVPYGALLLVIGTGIAQVSNVAIERCGQLAEGGQQEQRPCVLFRSLAPRPGTRNDNASIACSDGSSSSCVLGSSSQVSYMYDSVVMAGVGGNVAVVGNQSSTVRVELYGNVLYGSYAASNVQLLTTGNHLHNNLALGAISATANSSVGAPEIGAPGTAPMVIANFLLSQSANWVEGNVAAGSDRFGFIYQGTPCSPPATSPPSPATPSPPLSSLPPHAQATQLPLLAPWEADPVPWARGSFRNNTAHGALVGLWLRASVASSAVGCTALSNFTAHTNWDYGLITLRGIDTDVRLYDVALLDNRNAGAALLRQGGFTERAGVSWRGGLLAGRTSSVVCALCASPSDAGCHQRLTAQSSNRALPCTPSVGFVAAAFALGFSVGPGGGSPWASARGYPMVFGESNMTGVTVADFEGGGGCGGGSFAFANNPAAPDASHPHHLRRITLVNTKTDGPSQGIFLLRGPDPAWRNPLDCGTANYTSPSAPGAPALPLNCAGPSRALFKDLDGSLGLLPGGGPAVVLGAFPGGPRTQPVAQAPPVPSGSGCAYRSDLGTYVCVPSTNSSSGGMPSRGFDPQLFVLASRDVDAEREDAPAVAFNVSGSLDVVAPTMDQSWCFPEVGMGNTSSRCGQRLAAYWTTLPTRQTSRISFYPDSSAPRSFQMWLPYADPGAETILVIRFDPASLSRRFVWLPDTAERAATTAGGPPDLQDGFGHGAYWWDASDTTLTLKMVGAGTLEVRAEPAAMLGTVLAVPVSDFGPTQSADFVSRLTNASGLQPLQIEVVRVVAGSVRLNLLVYPDPRLFAAAKPYYWPAEMRSAADLTGNVVVDAGGLDSQTQAALWAQMVAAASAAPGGNTSTTALALQREAFIAAARERVVATLTASASADEGGTTAGERPPAPAAPPDAPLQRFTDMSASFFTAMSKVATVLSLPSAATGDGVLGVRVLEKPSLLSLFGVGGGDLLLVDPMVAAAASATLQDAVTAAQTMSTPPPPPPPPQTGQAGTAPAGSNTGTSSTNGSSPGGSSTGDSSTTGGSSTGSSSTGGGGAGGGTADGSSGSSSGGSNPGNAEVSGGPPAAAGAVGGGSPSGGRPNGIGNIPAAAPTTGITESGIYSPGLQMDDGNSIPSSSDGAFTPSLNVGSAPRQGGGNGTGGGADGSAGSGTGSSSGAGGTGTGGAGAGRGSSNASSGSSSLNLAILVPAVVGGMLLVALVAAAFGYAAVVRRRRHRQRHSTGGDGAAGGQERSSAAPPAAALATATSARHRQLGDASSLQVAGSGGSWAFRLRAGEDYELASRASTVVFEDPTTVALVLNDLDADHGWGSGGAEAGPEAAAAVAAGLAGGGWAGGTSRRGLLPDGSRPPPSPQPPLTILDEREEEAVSEQLASGAVSPLGIGSRSTSPQRWALLAAAAAAATATGSGGGAVSARADRLAPTSRVGSLRAAAPAPSRCASAANLKEEEVLEGGIRTAGSPVRYRTPAALEEGAAAVGGRDLVALRSGGGSAVQARAGEDAAEGATVSAGGGLAGVPSSPGPSLGVLAAAFAMLRRQGSATGAASASAAATAAEEDAGALRMLSRGGSFSIVSRKNSIVAVAPEPTPGPGAAGAAATAGGSPATATALSIGAAATAAAAGLAAARRRGGRGSGLPDLATSLSGGVLAAPPPSPTAAGVASSIGGGHTTSFSLGTGPGQGPGSARSRLAQQSRSSIVPFMTVTDFGMSGGPSAAPIVAAPSTVGPRAPFISGPGSSPLPPLPPRGSEGPPSAGVDGAGAGGRQRLSRLGQDSRATSAGGATPVTLPTATVTAATSRRSSGAGAYVSGTGAASPQLVESLRTTPPELPLSHTVVREGEPLDVADMSGGVRVAANAEREGQGAAMAAAAAATTAAAVTAKSPSLVGRFVAWARGLFSKGTPPGAAIAPEPVRASVVPVGDGAEPGTPFARASAAAAFAVAAEVPCAAAGATVLSGARCSTKGTAEVARSEEPLPQSTTMPSAHHAPPPMASAATTLAHASMAEAWDAAEPRAAGAHQLLAASAADAAGGGAGLPAPAAAAPVTACPEGLGPSVSAPADLDHGKGGQAADPHHQAAGLAAAAISGPALAPHDDVDAEAGAGAGAAAGADSAAARTHSALPAPQPLAATRAHAEAQPRGLPPKASAPPVTTLLSPPLQAAAPTGSSLPPLSRGRNTYRPRRLPPIEAAAATATATAAPDTARDPVAAGTHEAEGLAAAAATSLRDGEAAVEEAAVHALGATQERSSGAASPAASSPASPCASPSVRPPPMMHVAGATDCTLPLDAAVQGGVSAEAEAQHPHPKAADAPDPAPQLQQHAQPQDSVAPGEAATSEMHADDVADGAVIPPQGLTVDSSLQRRPTSGTSSHSYSHPSDGDGAIHVPLLQILAAQQQQQQQLAAAVAPNSLIPPLLLPLPTMRRRDDAGPLSPTSPQQPPQPASRPHSALPHDLLQQPQQQQSSRQQALAPALSFTRRDRRGLLDPLQLPSDAPAIADADMASNGSPTTAVDAASAAAAALQARQGSGRRLAPVASLRRPAIADLSSVFPAAAAADAAAAAAAEAAAPADTPRGSLARDFGRQSSVGSSSVGSSFVQHDGDVGDGEACEWDEEWGAAPIEAGGVVSATRQKPRTRFGAAASGTSMRRLPPLAVDQQPGNRSASPAAAAPHGALSRSFTAAAAGTSTSVPPTQMLRAGLRSARSVSARVAPVLDLAEEADAAASEQGLVGHSVGTAPGSPPGDEPMPRVNSGSSPRAPVPAQLPPATTEPEPASPKPQPSTAVLPAPLAEGPEVGAAALEGPRVAMAAMSVEVEPVAAQSGNPKSATPELAPLGKEPADCLQPQPGTADADAVSKQNRTQVPPQRMSAADLQMSTADHEARSGGRDGTMLASAPAGALQRKARRRLHIAEAAGADLNTALVAAAGAAKPSPVAASGSDGGSRMQPELSVPVPPLRRRAELEALGAERGAEQLDPTAALPVDAAPAGTFVGLMPQPLDGQVQPSAQHQAKQLVKPQARQQPKQREAQREQKLPTAPQQLLPAPEPVASPNLPALAARAGAGVAAAGPSGGREQRATAPMTAVGAAAEEASAVTEPSRELPWGQQGPLEDTGSSEQASGSEAQLQRRPATKAKTAKVVDRAAIREAKEAAKAAREERKRQQMAAAEAARSLRGALDWM